MNTAEALLVTGIVASSVLQTAPVPRAARGMRHGVPVLLMVSNVVWMLSPGLATRPEGSVPLALVLPENAARVVVLAVPFFYSVDVRRKYSTSALAGMALALAVYYAAWVRSFSGGGSPELLSAPIVGIPSPLALAPIALLIVSSYVLRSWSMLGASVVFGTLHVWVAAVGS